jgi:hypothetical protein
VHGSPAKPDLCVSVSWVGGQVVARVLGGLALIVGMASFRPSGTVSAEAVQEHRMALIDVCAAFVPPGHALAVRLRATHCPRAIALPQRGVLDGHAVLSLAFPPLSVGGATQGKSNGRQTRRSRSSVRR